MIFNLFLNWGKIKNISNLKNVYNFIKNLAYLLANFMLIQQYVYKEGYQIWMVSFQDFYTAYVVSKSKKNVDNLKIILK